MSNDQFPWAECLLDKSDRGRSSHGYNVVYDKYLLSIRHDINNVLEIGTSPVSAKLWLDYFPNANLYSIDNCPEITEVCKETEEENTRFKFNQIDQIDSVAQINLAKEVGGFDVIIDDGPHSSPEQLTSLSCLLKYLNPGGHYIIEDLHCTDPNDGQPNILIKDSEITMNDLLREYKDGVYKNYKYIENSLELKEMNLEICIERGTQIRWNEQRYPSEIIVIKKNK